MYFTGGNEKGRREGMLGPAETLGLPSRVPFRGTHLTHIRDNPYRSDVRLRALITAE